MYDQSYATRMMDGDSFMEITLGSPQPFKRKRSSILKPPEKRQSRDSRTVSFNDRCLYKELHKDGTCNITNLFLNQDMDLTMMEIVEPSPVNRTIDDSVDMSVDCGSEHEPRELEPELESDPELEQDVDIEVESEHIQVTEPIRKNETTHENELAHKPEPAPQIEATQETEPTPEEAEPTHATEPTLQAKPTPESEPEPESEPIHVTETTREPEPEPELKPQTEADQQVREPEIEQHEHQESHHQSQPTQTETTQVVGEVTVDITQISDISSLNVTNITLSQSLVNDTVYGAFQESVNNLSMKSSRTSGVDTLLHDIEALNDCIQKVDHEEEERIRRLDEEIEEIFKFYRHIVNKEDKYEFALAIFGLRHSLWLIIKINPETYPNERLSFKFVVNKRDKHLYPFPEYAQSLRRHTKVGSYGYLTRFVINAQRFRRFLRKIGYKKATK